MPSSFCLPSAEYQIAKQCVLDNLVRTGGINLAAVNGAICAVHNIAVGALLVKQVQSSVYMEDTLHRLGELGVDHILEVGPGSALAGFVKKTLPGVVCASVETPEQLNAALTAWKEEL